jgi:hypothetical protein
MPSTVDFTGLERLQARLRRIANPDATPLMASWMRIIDEDSRRGIMAGTDKDGAPLARVTYRPVGPKKGHAKHYKSPKYRGAYNPGVGGNLSSSQYRKMTGPPLAPRGVQSRVITNLKTGYQRLYTGRTAGAWEAFAYWDEVVNKKGETFLHYHFQGASGGGRKHNVTLPKRDLRGVRPEGREQARRALRAWMTDMVRST